MQHKKLKEIEATIKSGGDVKITSDYTGTDETASILLRIVLANQKKSKKKFPLDLLKEIIQVGSYSEYLKSKFN